jgi:hypothetical protein
LRSFEFIANWPEVQVVLAVRTVWWDTSIKPVGSVLALRIRVRTDGHPARMRDSESHHYVPIACRSIWHVTNRQ